MNLPEEQPPEPFEAPDPVPAAEVVVAEVVAEAARPARPQPSVVMALFWCVMLFAVQILGGLIVGVLLAVVVAVKHGGALNPDDFQAQMLAEFPRFLPLMLIFATVGNLLVALAAVFITYRRHAAAWIGWRRCSVMHQFLVVLAVIPFAVVASEVGNWVAEFVPPVESDVLAEFSRQPFWLVLIVACVLPAVGEEILFRGFIGRGLIAKLGPVAGVLLTSFLFGAVHIHPVQATGAFVLGVGLHIIYLKTHSLIAPMLLHMLNNALAFVAMRYGQMLPVEGFTELSENGVGHTPLVLFLLSVAAVVLLLLLFQATRVRWMLPDGREWSPGFVSGERPMRDDVRREIARPPVVLGLACLASVVAVYASIGIFAT